MTISRSSTAAAASYSTTAPKKEKNRIYNPVRTEDEFNTLNLLSASSRVPLITLWTASWCSSCAQISPLVQDLIKSGTGESPTTSVSFAEIQIDAPTIGPLAMRYMITSVPTLMAFDRQEAQLETRVQKLDDLRSRRCLIEWIEREAKRRGEGGAGGGSGASLFSALFGGGRS
ncbi:hypothetical protein AAFC00_001842 [Neodothiora populina]